MSASGDNSNTPETGPQGSGVRNHKSEQGKTPLREAVWIAPKTDEEWRLFDNLLADIQKMYAFARERGVAAPDSVIEGITELLAIQRQATKEITFEPDLSVSDAGGKK